MNHMNQSSLQASEQEWKQYTEKVERALFEAKNLGSTAAEASLNFETGLSTTVRKQSVESLQFSREKSLNITVYRGKRKGTASTSDLELNAIKTAVEAANQIAIYTEEDPYAGLPDQESLAKQLPNLELYHPWNVKSEEAIEKAKACEAAAFNYDKRISNSDGASLDAYTHYRVYGNSLGFLAAYPSTRYSLSCVLIAEAAGEMQRDYDFTVARSPEDLESVVSVGEKAANRTIDRLSGRKIKTGNYPIIFEARLASGLISQFVSAASGGQLYRKSSFLVDHLDKPVFPTFLNIKERPHLPKGMASVPFDTEGVATAERVVVENGILKSYFLSSYSARRLGLKSTGNAGGVHNLVLETGEKDLKDLLKDMQTGILVTELIGNGINLVTGDYSRGAFGFWVEQGEIQYPIQEFTIAGNLKEMFLNLQAVGRDVDRRSSILTGSLFLDHMTVGGE